MKGRKIYQDYWRVTSIFFKYAAAPLRHPPVSHIHHKVLTGLFIQNFVANVLNDVGFFGAQYVGLEIGKSRRLFDSRQDLDQSREVTNAKVGNLKVLDRSGRFQMPINALAGRFMSLRMSLTTRWVMLLADFYKFRGFFGIVDCHVTTSRLIGS